MSFPKYGDPELLPKGKVTRPSSRRMPFDRSGNLLPNGPEIKEPPGPRPDTEGLPWVRVGYHSWTVTEERVATLSYLRTFIATYLPSGATWSVTEKSTAPLSSLLLARPVLIFKITPTGGSKVELTLDFSKSDRASTVDFESRLQLLTPALLQLLGV